MQWEQFRLRRGSAQFRLLRDVMSAVIAGTLFLFGVCIAVVSAGLVVNFKKSWLWYALPLVYCMLVNTVGALAFRQKIDIAAIVFFALILTFLGWLIVRFEVWKR
jgi:hypothetical protein